MLGRDNLKKISQLRLMGGRLGTYEQPEYNNDNVTELNCMASRLDSHGGYQQQSRMIKDKRRSLDKAILYSYQGAQIKKQTYNENDEERPAPALINPNKLKQDYDDKVVSVGFEYDFQVGDVFQWMNTNSYWLIYLQDLTELAYFRGDIRKCSYEIAWEDEDGLHRTYAAIRGPVETKIQFIQKHNISVDEPNYSLNILMPKNEATLKYFRRYSKFYLQNLAKGDENKCWRVEATDSISMPGILEVNAVEYYINLAEDDLENGIAGGLIVEPISPNPEIIEQSIIGETFIKPKKFYEYQYQGDIIDSWSLGSKAPVEIEIDKEDFTKVKLRWTAAFSGQFDLKYGDLVKTIVVESLF